MRRVLSFIDPFVEVRPIPVHLATTDTAASYDQPFYVTMGYTQEMPPKLAYIKYDYLAYFAHLSKLSYPIAADHEMAEKLQKFLHALNESYNHKEHAALRSMHTDQAEIIVSRQEGESVKFYTRERGVYLRNLKSVLQNSTWLKVEYSGAKFYSVPGDTGKYVIDFHQRWQSPSYNDEGRVIMCVEFAGGQDLIINRICSPFERLTEPY